MYYLMARYYDPGIGRFLTRDPFKGRNRKPLSYNSYIYAYDNPANLTDLSGTSPEYSDSTYNDSESRKESEELIEKAEKQLERIQANYNKCEKAWRQAVVLSGDFAEIAGGQIGQSYSLGVGVWNFSKADSWNDRIIAGIGVITGPVGWSADIASFIGWLFF